MSDTTSIRRSERAGQRVGFAPGWPRLAADVRPVDSEARITFAPGWPEVALEPESVRECLSAACATGQGRR